MFAPEEQPRAVAIVEACRQSIEGSCAKMERSQGRIESRTQERDSLIEKLQLIQGRIDVLTREIGEEQERKSAEWYLYRGIVGEMESVATQAQDLWGQEKFGWVWDYIKDKLSKF
jgi:hypothetical protein